MLVRNPKNGFCINWTSVAPDIQVGMDEGQHWQIARFDFESYDFHDLPFFYFLVLDVQKGMDVSFLMPLESLHFDL
jgi:hypothetical protein